MGEVGGKIPVWSGYSVNLAKIDFRYRAIFIDVVENLLSAEQRTHYLGAAFTEAIRDMPKYVVMFVLDFPASAGSVIETHGYVPRRMGSGRVLHACKIARIEEFLAYPPLYWTAHVTRLVLLQRFLSVHRKPIDANEVPLQNLLFQTGYLHAYLVKGGLVLYELSQPRRAGDFGHDFQAIVANSSYPELPSFSLGLELYMGPAGYHLHSIPHYITQFGLRGIVVIAKDNPIPSLADGPFCGMPVFEARRLAEIGPSDKVGIHHLPLDKVVVDLASMRDKLEEVVTISPFDSRSG